MNTFLTAVTVAVLAFVALEITQSDAQGGGERRCPASQRPPLVQPSKVKCDFFQGIIRPLACLDLCSRCHGRENLGRSPSCLVQGRCTCLAKPATNSTTTTTTTVAPTTGLPAETTGPAAGTTGPVAQTTGPAAQTTGPAAQTTGPAAETTPAGITETAP